MDFFSNHKKGVTIFIVFLLIIMMIFTYVYNEKATFAENAIAFFVVPLQKATTSVSNSFSKKFSSVIKSKVLENENIQLLEENSKLKEKLNRLELQEKQNIHLSELLKIQQKYNDLPIEGAMVIAKNPSSWMHNFIIDKGSKHGIEPNMLVLSAEGVIGYTVKVGYNQSQVLTIIDDQSALSVMNKRTEESGILKGDYELSDKGLCRLDYLGLDAEIMQGDEIITSSYSGYPPGVYIGYVKEVKTDISGLTKYAIIEPSTSFKDLDSVLIVKKTYLKIDKDLS